MEHVYFGYSHTQPELEGIVVKRSIETEFLGFPFTFNIIGYSHYITSKELGFYEIASCKRPQDDGYSELPLEVGVEDSFEFAVDGTLSCTTTLKGLPLGQYPSEDEFDLHHRFGEQAYTSLNISEMGYESYHTYPEYDLALYTRTQFDG